MVRICCCNVALITNTQRSVKGFKRDRSMLYYSHENTSSCTIPPALALATRPVGDDTTVVRSTLCPLADAAYDYAWIGSPPVDVGHLG